MVGKWEFANIYGEGIQKVLKCPILYYCGCVSWSADNPLNLSPPLYGISPNRTICLCKSVLRNFDSHVYQHYFVLLYTAYLP